MIELETARTCRAERFGRALFALWHYYTEHVVHLSDFEAIRKKYVEQQKPKPTRL